MENPRRVVTSSPENSETPLERVASWVTPNRLFFVRNHFEPPPVGDTATWELAIDGLVARPRRWTFAQLAARPQHAVFATVECAGNGRSFLEQKAAGVQWGAGAIGHAEWSGVPLRELLAEAGVKPGTLEIVFEGADRGTEDGKTMNFSRSLPLAKALDPDTLIALRMNGEWLEPNHGAPLRLFVPGWYGVASVKWLRRMTAIDHAYQGYFQTVKYSIDRDGPGGKRRVPLGPGVVKSEILSPRVGEVVGLGVNRVAGVAWAGEDRIARVEISADGGKSWGVAKLKGPVQPYSWCQWEFLWTVETAGTCALMSRAFAAAGQAQPFRYDPDNLGYVINVVRPHPVDVAAGARIAAGYADDAEWSVYMESFAEANTRRPLDVELALTGGDGI